MLLKMPEDEATDFHNQPHRDTEFEKVPSEQQLLVNEQELESDDFAPEVLSQDKKQQQQLLQGGLNATHSSSFTQAQAMGSYLNK